MRKTYTVDIQALCDQAERKGIQSAEELSEKSGINKEVLLPILEGRSLPSYDIMVGLATALELSPELAGAIFFDNNLRNR